MACIWTGKTASIQAYRLAESLLLGVQSFIGGNCVYVLLRAMAPSYANIPNGIPDSGTDTAHFGRLFLRRSTSQC